MRRIAVFYLLIACAPPAFAYDTQAVNKASVSRQLDRPGATAGQTPVEDYLVVVRATPTDPEIGRAVLKGLGALVFHEAGKAQPDDTFAKTILRAIARQTRDELIESLLKDLFPSSQVFERLAIRNLAVLALDGRLARNRDRVLDQLRQVNPNMADAVEVAEFLIRLAQAIDQARN